MKDFIEFKSFHKSLKNQIELIKLHTGYKVVNPEFCPIFPFDSLKPKISFNFHRNFGDTKIMDIERGLLAIYGLPTYGVHCNVWSKNRNDIIIHLGKRSKKIRKFPGYFDNLIAGGQPSNISIEDNLRKEAYEEAGMGKEIIKKSFFSNAYHYMHNEKLNFISAIIFVYHLELNKKIKFRNIDGEVEDFISLPFQELYKILENNFLKPNCIIPIIDLIVSKFHGFVPKSFMIELNKIISHDYFINRTNFTPKK